MSTPDFIAPDGHARCAWCGGAPEFLPYHDAEWGFPVADDVRLFEKLCLEAFQSGLSWRTILNKREAFRAAFDGFDFHKMARYTEADVTRLLGDAGIVRHRGKIEAVIHNAGRAVELQRSEGSLAAFFWRYEPTAAEVAEQMPVPQVATQPPAAVKLAKALKSRGWKFVGPTTAFAFMQAMGLVNDHTPGCVTRAAVAKARLAFTPPKTPNPPKPPSVDWASWRKDFEAMDEDAQAAALRAITQTVPPAEAALLLALADDAAADFELRVQALKVLGLHSDLRARSPAAKRIVAIALRADDDEPVRVEAIAALMFLPGSEQWLPDWQALCLNADEDIDVRYAAFDAMARNSNAEARQAGLQALLKDAEFSQHARIALDEA